MQSSPWVANITPLPTHLIIIVAIPAPWSIFMRPDFLDMSEIWLPSLAD